MDSTQRVWKLYTRYAEAWKPQHESERQAILAEVLDTDFQYQTPEFEGGLERC